MPFRRRMLGLELNDTLLKLVEVQSVRRKVRLNQVVAHPLPSVWSKDGEFIEKEELVQSVREALLGRRFATRKVHMAINSRHVLVQRERVPQLGKRRLRRWIKEKVIPELGFSDEEVVFDFILLDKHELEEERDLLLVAASKEYVDTLLKIIEWCGLEPVSLELSSLGLYRWLRFSTEKLSSQLITLHLSLTGVELSWFKDGDIQDITFLPLSMPSYRIGPDHPQTDPLKPILMVEKEIEQYGQQLLAAVNEKLAIWKDQHRITPGQWILTGDGIDFSMLKDWLSKQIDGKVEIGPPPENILSSTLQERVTRWLGSSMSVPIGLLLNGRELT
ncbi:pilus assembly protein PilM [Paenactinomyces guangxiensis]|uniref:Pilus assembly protein PilM n=1 Tax=Paenactinomyces guangxiensis TaxID=1490290 RepID=A0A7W1WU67_9BACL|nr:pilus assembly protein PilM [Paenactinomyces guangxiensis]MBA4496148.1 pilus assembly protein PilM [Paenactinomyces guangxiensis]MBH8593236.1 pilus assembly protein PilM [Paenactinomyces guangxiensis]